MTTSEEQVPGAADRIRAAAVQLARHRRSPVLVFVSQSPSTVMGMADNHPQCCKALVFGNGVDSLSKSHKTRERRGAQANDWRHAVTDDVLSP